jgi:F-type H+-transporting ATPase subunit epsilon
MRTFTLHLQDATRSERIEHVASFVGLDGSGSFGILGGHARMMTVLAFGLARFRTGDGPWQFLAIPEGVLYFAGDDLTINTRRYLRDDDYDRISEALEAQLRAEETELRGIKDSVRRLQEELFRRLWQLGRGRAAV